MERFQIIKELGEGSFGSVWQAINKENGEVVAIKKVKRIFYSWEECLNLQEVKSLRKMNHPNIVKLKEVIRECNILYFVFEYMDCSLYQLMKHRGKAFLEAEVRTKCLQVFLGLAYMHQEGYFHRDLKPDNLLVSEDITKIADLGSARGINSPPPYTHYVTTRWYRAPEVMLQSQVYGSAVDLWAMGTIMAELFTLNPLFPGSSQVDQMYQICSVIGTPTKNEWDAGLKLASAIDYQFPQVATDIWNEISNCSLEISTTLCLPMCNGVPLSVLIPSASEDAIDLITKLCSWDPCKRPTALEALQHPFFQSCFRIPPSLPYRISVNVAPLSEKKALPRRYGPNSIPPGFSHPSNPHMYTKAGFYHGEIRQGVTETSKMLANMNIGSAKVPIRQNNIQVPLMKAGGGWERQYNLWDDDKKFNLLLALNLEAQR